MGLTVPRAAELWKEVVLRTLLIAGFAMALLVAGRAAAQMGPPGDGEASQRAQWGLLADLAGRDFDGCEAGMRCRTQMIVRWEQTGRALVIESEQEGIRRTDTIHIDPGGVLQLVRDDHGNGYWRDAVATVASDGGVMFVLSGTWVEQWRLLPNGRVEVETGRQSTSSGYRRELRRRFTDSRFASAAARERVTGFRARLAALSPAVNGTGVAATVPSQAASPVVLPALDRFRIALVIGVSTYGTLGDLPNPANDARLVAAALRRVGFDVELLIDPDQRAMRQAVVRLGDRMSAVGAGGTGLFFFAGHGIQARGVNYLIPARAGIVREADLAIEAIPADSVLLQMQDAGVSTNILILDACRNMPLTRAFRNGVRGLAPMDAANGSFIAYSTAPGSVAADGDGDNSPFAAALTAEIPRPGQAIEAIFRNVRRSVLEATNGAQTPWDSSSLVDPFYFVPD